MRYDQLYPLICLDTSPGNKRVVGGSQATVSINRAIGFLNIFQEKYRGKVSVEFDDDVDCIYRHLRAISQASQDQLAPLLAAEKPLNK